MKNIIKYIIVLPIFFLLWSCDEKEDYEQINSSTVDLAGEWYVAYYIDGTPITGVSSLLSYNTAADDGTELWVDDENHFWHFKVKAKVNAEGMSFGSADELDNASYTSKVILQNGKLFEAVSKQPSGVMTDSIYFEVLFDDDGYTDDDDNYVVTPYATTYQCIGVRKTGFLEDEP